MKEIYTKPVSEVEEFKVAEDVMTASFGGGIETGGPGLE